jgi:hypothetical protein
MGAIADFKKRRAAERAQQANVKTAQQQVSETKAPENEALALLAALIGVNPENAIEAAKELAEKEYVVVDQDQLVELEKAVDNAKFESAERLDLLAELLGVDEAVAVTQAKILIGKGGYFAGLTEEQREAVMHQIGVDLASGEDKTVIANVKGGQIESITELAKQTATDLEQSAGAVEGAADAVTGAAEQVGSAAADLEGTANQLAYTAEDIGQVTADLKEATAELKKPSVAPASSRGKTDAKAKSSSKKSG